MINFYLFYRFFRGLEVNFFNLLEFSETLISILSKLLVNLNLVSPPSIFYPIYSSCSSGRGFAADFLQIPPRDGHPCLKLMVATANPITDFHCQAITHARRTRLPCLYRRGTHLNRLLSVPVYREFALIPTLTDGEFPLN